MHLPEHILGTGCFGGLGGEGRFVVDGVEGKMAINNAQLIGKSVFQTLEQGGEPRAAWSLEVAVFDQDQTGVGPSLSPVIRLNLGNLPRSGWRGRRPTGGRFLRRGWGVFRRCHSGCWLWSSRCGLGRRRLTGSEPDNQQEAKKCRDMMFHRQYLSRSHLFLKTRTSPTRLVTRRSSRCSMRARAYFRLAPNMSRTWAMVMFPSRRMWSVTRRTICS
jgi:hypothetical protein